VDRVLNRRGGVSLILGMHRIIGHEEREMGFRSLLRERFPACTIAASLESGEDQGRAGEVVYQALRSNPGVQGIYNVSAGNSAIAKVIRALGLTQKIVLITHELTPERRAMLREGVLDAIIGQNLHPRELPAGGGGDPLDRLGHVPAVRRDSVATCAFSTALAKGTLQTRNSSKCARA
jgi:LacI family transcriptional regulator